MTNLLNSRVAFTLFGVDIYWYGIMITSGVLVAFLLAFLLCKKKGHDGNLPYEIFLAIIPLGILGARLFSVIFEDGLTIADFFKFREGGMSIIGAIIGGLIGVIILCLIRKHNFLDVADLIVTVLILAQAIGRWGNYFNNELYGQQITNPNLQWFPFAVQIDGLYYEALFFYESFFNIIGFVIIFCLFWFIKNKGVALGTYLIYYGTLRFILEPRRQAEFILDVGSVQVSRLMSAVMVIIGIGVLMFVIIKHFKVKKERKISG